MTLIDADALLGSLQELFDKREMDARFMGNIGVFVGWNDAIYHIKIAKTIDAAPVVRCRDCCWQGDDEHCPICNCCGREELPDGDWYCADGKRKDTTNG